MEGKGKNIVVVMCSVIMTIIAVGGILYACGAVTGDVQENKDDIVNLQKSDKEQGAEIVNLRIAAERQQSTADSTLKVLTAIHGEIGVIRKEQSSQATIQAVNSTKLESLTKD